MNHVEQLHNNKKEILIALEKQKGIVSSACSLIGLSRSTYYHWLREDAEFAAAVEEIQEVAIDFVESKLMEKINGISMSSNDGEGGTYTLPPSDTAIIFFLKTKGKKRGYKETFENHNVNYNVEVSKDEAKDISEALENKF